MAMALVQSKAANGLSVTLDAAPTAGNLLVAWCTIPAYNGTVVPTGFTAVTGYVQIPTEDDGTPSATETHRGRMYYRVVQSGDTATIAITGGGRTAIAEFSGATTWELVTFATNADDTDVYAPASQLLTAGTVTPPNGPVVIVAGFGGGPGNNDPLPISSPGAGFTELDMAKTGAGAPDTACSYRIVASPSGSYTATETFAIQWGISRGHAGVVAAFAQAPEAIDVFSVNPAGTLTFLDNIDPKSWSIRVELNAPGSGQIVLNRHNPEVTAALLAAGNLVKIRHPRIGTDYIFSFFLEPGEVTLISPTREGGEDAALGGPGGFAYWERAIWLSEQFLLPWWPATMATPPAGTRGAVIVVAGTYRQYTIVGGVITGFSWFTTTGFSAYFDTRQTYDWPAVADKRFLVHLTTTEDPASPSYVGYFIHPHQTGVTETLKTRVIGSQILLSGIGTGNKPGQIIRHLYDEGKAATRPQKPIPLMTADFSDTLDSNGAAWTVNESVSAIQVSVHEPYSDTIGKLVDTGSIDVRMGPDLDMHAYNSYGRDLTGAAFGAGVVRFVKGVNIADQLKRELASDFVATYAGVAGLEDTYAEAALPDAATRVAREVGLRGDSADATALTALGLAQLNGQLRRSDALAIAVDIPMDGFVDPLTGKYLPGPPGSNGHFWVGDTVTLHTGTGAQDFNNVAMRIWAITLSADDAGNLRAIVSLGSRLGARDEPAALGSGGSAGGSFVMPSTTPSTETGETSADLDLHLADTIDAHDASAVSFTPTGTIAATDVQAAIAEVASEVFNGVIVTGVPSPGATIIGTSATTAQWTTGGVVTIYWPMLALSSRV